MSLCQRIGQIVDAEKLERPTCFIGHADTGEKPEVLDRISIIVRHLKAAGIDTLFDRDGDHGGLPIGEDIDNYMEKGIKTADYVIMFFTPVCITRANALFSGLKIEITNLLERLNRKNSTNCFIPIVLEGTPETSIPAKLRNFLAISQDPKEGPELRTQSCMLELLKLMRDRIYKNAPSIIDCIKIPERNMSVLTSFKYTEIEKGNSVASSSSSSRGETPMNRADTDPFQEVDLGYDVQESMPSSRRGSTPMHREHTNPYHEPELGDDLQESMLCGRLPSINVDANKPEQKNASRDVSRELSMKVAKAETGTFSPSTSAILTDMEIEKASMGVSMEFSSKSTQSATDTFLLSSSAILTDSGIDPAADELSLSSTDDDEEEKEK